MNPIREIAQANRLLLPDGQNFGCGRFAVFIAAAVMIVLAGFLIFERAWAYHQPIGRDVSIYAMLGHELLAGRPLYSDLLEIRPPAVMVSYAAAEIVAGQGRSSIFLLYILVSLVTLVGIYYASSAKSGVVAGVWASAFWVVLSASGDLEAGEPNTEIFINACLVWAFALLIRADDKTRTMSAFAIGTLFALASLYKHVAIIAAVFLALTHLVFPPAGQIARRRALRDVAVMAGVGILTWSLISAYFAATGRFGIFSEMMLGSSLDYAAGRQANFAPERAGAVSVLMRNLTAPFRGESEFLLDVLNPLAALTVLGTVIGLFFTDRRRWAMLAAFLVATWIEIALPGQFFHHYFQLWLPPLAIGAGWGIGVTHQVTAQRRWLAWLPHALGVLVLTILLLNQLPWYRMNFSGDFSHVESLENRVAQPLAFEINQMLGPGETFYEWGGNPVLYLLTERRPPTGVFMPEFLLSGKLANQLSERVVADLEREQPELLVISKNKWPEDSSGNLVVGWLVKRYQPLPGNADRGPFTLHIRRSGKLEARIHHRPR